MTDLPELVKRLEFIANNPRSTLQEEITEVCDLAAAALSEREGWVTVPKEPTMGQWDDFCSVYPIGFGEFQSAYRAMVKAAAPSAEGKDE